VHRLRDEDGGGVDVVLDGVGGRTSLRSFRALRRHGRLVIFGLQVAAVGGRRSTRGLLAFYAVTGATLASNLVPAGRRVSTYRIARLKQRHPEWFREDLKKVLGMLAASEISPVISARLSLAEGREAQEMLGRGEAMGKLVLCPSQMPQ
jgi:NADPH:quinone reductase